MIYPHFRGNSSARLKSDLHLKEINAAAKVHLMTKAVCHVDKKARSQQAPLNFRKLLKGRKGHLKFQRNFFSGRQHPTRHNFYATICANFLIGVGFYGRFIGVTRHQSLRTKLNI